MLGKQWDWGFGVTTPSQEFCTNFYNRTLDVINRYNPDLLYFDTTIVPFYPVSDAGLKIAAHFYNHNIVTHPNDFSAVMFGKILPEQWRDALVWDVERGAPNEISPQPWQTCTCIGNWHYNDSFYEKNRYKSAAQVIKLLADVVSKNGNLLLSVPLRADGTFDEKEEAIIREIGAWLNTNGEGIYSTRPWKVFGEGPIAGSKIKMKDQGFNEDSYLKAGADEIRCTQTKQYLYAIALGWPSDGKILVKSLAKGNDLHPKKIRRVELLGFGKVPFSQTDEGLVVSVPDTAMASVAPVLKIAK